MNRIVPLLAVAAMVVAVSACGHQTPRAAATASPAATFVQPPSVTPLIENTPSDQVTCDEFVSDFDSGFAAAQQNELNAWVSNTAHKVDPVLVQDVNTFLSASQRGPITGDSPAAMKIFNDCHSIGS